MFKQLQFIIFLFISFNSFSQEVCFISTKKILKAKGLEIELPYLCSFNLAVNTSADVAFEFNSKDKLTTQWLIVQLGLTIKGFSEDKNIPQIKSSFTSKTDSVISVKKVNLGKSQGWEIVYNRTKDTLFNKVVDYVYNYKGYYISIVFFCSGVTANKDLVINKFNSDYKLFKSTAIKLSLN